MGPLLPLLFANDLPDALDELTLIFRHDAERVTLIATWDWLEKLNFPINRSSCNYLSIEREAVLRYKENWS